LKPLVDVEPEGATSVAVTKITPEGKSRAFAAALGF
jgi:hypothetical protein